MCWLPPTSIPSTSMPTRLAPLASPTTSLLPLLRLVQTGRPVSHSTCHLGNPSCRTAVTATCANRCGMLTQHAAHPENTTTVSSSTASLTCALSVPRFSDSRAMPPILLTTAWPKPRKLSTSALWISGIPLSRRQNRSVTNTSVCSLPISKTRQKLQNQRFKIQNSNLGIGATIVSVSAPSATASTRASSVPTSRSTMSAKVPSPLPTGSMASLSARTTPCPSTILRQSPMRSLTATRSSPSSIWTSSRARASVAVPG